MSVSDGPRRATFVRLPGDVQRPFQVFLNGVEQREGVDFVVRDGTLVFERPLAKEELGAGGQPATSNGSLEATAGRPFRS